MLKALGISESGRNELSALIERGTRLVSVEDAAEALNVDRSTAAKRLARWAHEGWLRRVRRGLYIPVPLEAENPASWSENPLILADAVWGPCYFTGWTAANHWGLTDQIFHTTVVKTTRRVRSSREFLLGHEYLLTHTTGELMEWGVSYLWQEDYKLSIADQARTVVDILDKPILGGGIRLCAEILTSYLDDQDWHTLVEYGGRLGNRAVFKRLGYLVETFDVGDKELGRECKKRISTGISLLDPSAKPSGKTVTRWGVRVNAEIEGRSR